MRMHCRKLSFVSCRMTSTKFISINFKMSFTRKKIIFHQNDLANKSSYNKKKLANIKENFGHNVPQIVFRRKTFRQKLQF